MLLGFICFKSLASDKHVIKEVFCCGNIERSFRKSVIGT